MKQLTNDPPRERPRVHRGTLERRSAPHVTPAPPATTGRYERPPAPGAADVEVVVPVHNEERVLAASVTRLHAFLTERMPFSWRITIADNASTDGTQRVAEALAYDLPGVSVLRLEEKGRGRALRAAWSASRARVVCYMDVDLSTDLRALLPLVAAPLSGHSDVAIGSRLARGARVTRGLKRELISRAYNRLLRVVLQARFSDAQCGFKAARRDALLELLGQVADQSWFFDTELLVAAQRRALRIHEIAVDWVEDTDSRVDIVATALADLRGIARLSLARPLVRFALIGTASTAAYSLLFAALAGPVGAAAANLLALGATAVANTAANRRLTFGVRGRAGILRQHSGGLVVFGLALAITSGALELLHLTDPRASHSVQLLALIAATVVATLVRYLAMRTWIFPARSAS